MDTDAAAEIVKKYGTPIERKSPHTARMLRFITSKGREYALQVNRSEFFGIWLEPISLSAVSGSYEIEEYAVGKGRSSHLSVMKQLCDSREAIYVKCNDLASLEAVLKEYAK